jgi:transcriptional regulator with XRE-family HTH domain
MSDQAIAEQIGRFVKQKRIEQNRNQQEVSEYAGISRSTLSLLERGEPVTIPTLIRVLRVLDQLQVFEAFNTPSVLSPLEQAKAEQKQRQRARKTGKRPSSDW